MTPGIFVALSYVRALSHPTEIFAMLLRTPAARSKLLENGPVSSEIVWPHMHVYPCIRAPAVCVPAVAVLRFARGVPGVATWLVH